MIRMNRTAGGALVVLGLALVLAFPAAAHEQTFMGTVASIEGEHLHITTTEKKEVMVMLHDKTKILRGKEAAKAEDIKVGERIVVITTDGKDESGTAMLMAKEIRLAATAPKGVIATIQYTKVTTTPSALAARPDARSGAGEQTGGQGGHQVSPSTGEVAVIEKWLAEYDAAFNAKDLEKLSSFYHPEVTIYEGGGVDNGWAAYRDGHLGPELKAFENLQFAHTNRQIHVLGDGRSAYAVSQYTLKAKMGERDIDAAGLETLVLVKGADGSWRIRHSHTSSRPRRPAGG